jgi:hypothetical protein
VALQEGKHSIEGLRNRRIVEFSVEAMASVADGNQFVFDPGTGELFRHDHRLLVRHIGILVSMKKQCRRIVFGWETAVSPSRALQNPLSARRPEKITPYD